MKPQTPAAVPVRKVGGYWNSTEATLPGISLGGAAFDISPAARRATAQSACRYAQSNLVVSQFGRNAPCTRCTMVDYRNHRNMTRPSMVRDWSNDVNRPQHPGGIVPWHMASEFKNGILAEFPHQDLGLPRTDAYRV